MVVFPQDEGAMPSTGGDGVGWLSTVNRQRRHKQVAPAMSGGVVGWLWAKAGPAEEFRPKRDLENF
jgi:hypothetical protein